MRSKDIDNLENILLDLEDVENGAMISLSQGEINSLESILETLKESISKDKIREKIKKLRKEEDRIEKLDYRAEPEEAIDVVLLRIADLQELLEEK